MHSIKRVGASILAISAAAKHITTKPTFFLGYRQKRCFSEMMYFGSTFELFVELIEPEMLRDEWISDPLRDGIHYSVMMELERGEYVTVEKGVLGNKDHNSFLSFN